VSAYGELLVIVGVEVVELTGLVVESLDKFGSGFRARLLACKLVLVIGGDILVVALLVELHVRAVLIFDGEF
jgi:hypothetical protein